MEKVKINHNQEVALDDYKEWHVNEGFDLQEQFRHFVRGPVVEKGWIPLNGFEPDEFALLLCGWYEVEPEFKAGDCLIFTGDLYDEVIFGKINEDMVVEWSDDVTNDLANIKRLYKEGNLRHATPSEIAEEKERRFFARNGRDVWELKVGDVLSFRESDRTFTVERVGVNNVVLEDINYKLKQIKQAFRVACFSHDRLDVKTNE